MPVGRGAAMSFKGSGESPLGVDIKLPVDRDDGMPVDRACEVLLSGDVESLVDCGCASPVDRIWASEDLDLSIWAGQYPAIAVFDDTDCELLP